MRNFKNNSPLLFPLVWLLIIVGLVNYAPAGIIQAIVPQAAPTANKRGNGTVFQLAGSTATAAAGTPFCDDGNGNTTTSGCAGGGGGAPVTFFQTVTGNSTNVAPSMTVMSGSLLFSVGARNAGLANPCTPTDTQLNTWTQAAWGTTTGGFPNQVNISWAIAGTTGADVITNCATALAYIIAGEIRGSIGTTTDAVFGSTTGSAPLPLTMTATGDLVLTATSGCNASSDFSAKMPELIFVIQNAGGGCGAVALISMPSNVSGTAISTLSNVNAAEPFVGMAFKTH